MDEKTPIRRLVLKKSDVEPVDKVARPGDGTAISVRLIHLENKLAADKPLMPVQVEGAETMLPTDETGAPIFKLREITPLDPPSIPGDEAAISVSDILQENRVAAFDTEPQLIAMPPRRRSRRNRDFVALVSLALLSVGVLAIVFRNDRQVVALALFGIVFLTVILAWIMYGVMDRY